MKKFRSICLAACFTAQGAAVCPPASAAESLAAFASIKTIEQPMRDDTRRPAVVTGVALAPGGKLLATAGDDHELRFWNPTDGSLVQQARAHRDWVRTLAFSPDGALLASGGDDRRVVLWDVASGRRLGELPLQQATIYSVAFSADGKWLAAAGFEPRVYLYDVAARSLTRTIAGPCADLRAVTFSNDSQRLAIAGRSGRALIVPLGDGTPLNIAADHERVRTLAFSPDGKVLATGGESRTITLWNAETGDEVGRLTSPTAKIMSLTFCGDQRLATGGSDNAIAIWNLTNGTTEHQFLGHTGSVSSLVYDAPSRTIVSGSFDTTIRVWQLPAVDRDDVAVDRPTNR